MILATEREAIYKGRGPYLVAARGCTEKNNSGLNQIHRHEFVKFVRGTFVRDTQGNRALGGGI
jgi:hypothetical protein